ncbi:uncharacterized protein LOC110853630 [Folsomia candida]|uniref:uncharacterized protein LOC110853630 n=1 Tax=Folsomia candida TaxID=158441 RepID=UPI001605018D|nr:uncharacterized protein LOC110853630 [Folsomia candida]
MEVAFSNLGKVSEEEEEEEDNRGERLSNVLEDTVISMSDNNVVTTMTGEEEKQMQFDQEDSDISDAMLDSSSPVFKWLTKITGVDLRIRCDVFLEPPKVHLDLTLSTGRHLCLDNLRQCSDDAIEDITKNKTVMVRTYKGKDLLKIKCTHDSKIFSVMEPHSDQPVSIMTISQTRARMEIHNLVQDEWYFVDLSNRRSKLILLRSESGSELGRIEGFGDFEPQSSFNGNVMILKPKLKFTWGSDVEGLDNIQKAILLSIFIALGLTFDGDVRKTTDAFNLFATLTMAILIICSVMVYRNSESFKAHRNLIFVINCVVLLFILGFLYLVRCCLR